jgi:hypothetical protein
MKKKVEPGDPGSLEQQRLNGNLRARHEALKRAIEERGLAERDLEFRRLMRLIAQIEGRR